MHDVVEPGEVVLCCYGCELGVGGVLLPMLKIGVVLGGVAPQWAGQLAGPGTRWRAAAAWPPPRANQTPASPTSDSNFRPQLGLAPVQPMASILQKKL